ncbi:MAG: hypothetical protein VYA55_07765 [Pseudomonadota bacterium]|nr:hypothetical protein [Pseudomonadota bacterium]
MQRDAWYLSLSNRHHLTVARQQVAEYLTRVTAYSVPGCNPHCNQLIQWRGRLVPLWGGEQQTTQTQETQHAHVLVVSYEDEAPALLALSLQEAPQPVQVRDEDQCLPSPEQEQYWQQAILGCFQHREQPVPVIGFARLGSGSMDLGNQNQISVNKPYTNPLNR